MRAKNNYWTLVYDYHGNTTLAFKYFKWAGYRTDDPSRQEGPTWAELSRTAGRKWRCWRNMAIDNNRFTKEG